jgi:PAS domain S-box-containing protein
MFIHRRALPRLLTVLSVCAGSLFGTGVEPATGAPDKPPQVTISGVVRKAVIDGADVELSVATNAMTLRARAPRQGLDERALVDSDVRIIGVWTTIAGGPNEPLKRVLQIERPSHITIVKQGAADPFDAPRVLLADVLRLTPGNIPLHRVKVIGTVTAQVEDYALFLTDGTTHDMLVRLIDAQALVPGDEVEAVGYVGRLSSPRILVDTVVRQIGNRPAPSPARLEAARLLDKDYHNTLVSVEATLARRSEDTGDHELVLHAGGIRLEAWLPLNKGAAAFDALVDGSQLEVTGIAAVRTSTTGEPISVRLRLRDANDVRVLALPSWWTVQRTLYMLTVVVIGLVGSAGWVVALRRRLPVVERARLESEERYRQLFDEAPAGHFVCRADGILTASNEAFARMLGFDSPGATIGVSCESLYVDRADRDAWLEFLKHGTPLENRKTTLKAVDGRRIPVVKTAVARLDALSKVTEIQGFLIDRTEPERAEAVLRERDSQLQQAQKMEALGRLAGGIAHDFNNLLTVISGFSELAQMESRGRQPLAGYIQEVHKAAETGAGLTRQMLAFSRKQVFEPMVVDLNVIITELEKMLRRLLGEDIRLTLSTSSDALHVKADPAQLEQVLVNLAVNARDAMPNGGALEIKTALDGSDARLVLSDTGCGMDENTLAHMFEPFFTTKAPGQGTGLGLATVYAAVAQCGGSVNVSSASLRGTTFVITLPRVAPPEEALPVCAVAPAPTGGETILLVEDDPGVRALTRSVLKRAGYNVLVASDGHAALAMASGHAGVIDLLLTDVVMPGMSGIEVARWFADAKPQTRVLLMSGYADHPALKRQPMPVEAAQIQKPFSTTALCAAVRQTLDGLPVGQTPGI